MSRKILVLLLGIIFLINGTYVTTIVKAEGTLYVTQLNHKNGYLLGIKGQEIDTSKVEFVARYNDSTQENISGSLCTWASTDQSIAAIESGKIKILKQGVVKLTVSKDSAQMDLWLVTKEAESQPYILYQENFDGYADGAMPSDWARKEGTTTSKCIVKDKAFVMDARTSADNPTRVILPRYLGLFGDYIIEADFTHLATNNTSRWNSIMYRIQNNDYPYYQMAVRKNATATNGVEFAERTSENKWNVMKATSYTENISASKMYHYKVIAHGNRIQEYIDDKLLIDEFAPTYLKGEIGIQADGSHTKIDNIKITLSEQPLPPLPGENYTRVKEADTKIALSPTNVTYIESLNQLNNIVELQSASSVVLPINSQLNVVNSEGAEIGNLIDIYNITKEKVIPIFKLEDSATVDQFTSFVKNNGVEDAFVMSSQPDVVKQVVNECSKIMGAVEFSFNTTPTNEQLYQVVVNTNSNRAKVAVLPANILSRENINYLHKQMIVVWGKGAELKLSIHQLITKGVDGIVSASPNTVNECLTFYNNDITLTRRPFIVGHRGIPSVAPENSMAGYRKAYELGADAVETDIYVTTDKRLVIMHNSTIDSTTNGTGYIEDKTLEELKEYLIDTDLTNYPNEKIPTLDELFDFIKGKDLVVYVEIKTSNENVAQLLADLIREKQVEDQVIVISFKAQVLTQFYNIMPQISIGLLVDKGRLSTADPYGSLSKVYDDIYPFNAFYNSNYTQISKDFMDISRHRGIMNAAWTFRNKTDLYKYFQYGLYGITTDYAQWMSGAKTELESINAKEIMTIGDEKSLVAKATDYIDNQVQVIPEVIVIDGGEHVQVTGNNIKAISAGTSSVILRYSSDIEGETYDLYSEPIQIKITEYPFSIHESSVELADTNSINVSTRIKNNSDVEQYAIVIIAVYKQGGKLKQVKSSTKVFKAGEQIDVRDSFLEMYNTENGYVKIFVWDAFNSMNNLSINDKVMISE